MKLRSCGLAPVRQQDGKAITYVSVDINPVMNNQPMQYATRKVNCIRMSNLREGIQELALGLLEEYGDTAEQ